MINIYIAKIHELDEAERKKIINTLSDPALVRLDKKKNAALRHASLCALSLLSDDERADLTYTENGKPHFKILDKSISITHSETHAAVAISDSRTVSVGIDIEALPAKPVENGVLDVPPTRFLTENEQTLLKGGTGYTEIWTKKEALFKFLKNDSLILPKIDSTEPQKYGAVLNTIQIGSSILSLCTPDGEKFKIIQK